MRSKYFRLAIMVSVLAITIAAFSYYFATHPALRIQLRHTSPKVLVVLLLLYVLQIAAIGLTVLCTMSLCKVKLAVRESLLLTMYTVVINFFGPLQSGPAFRALYMKQKHGLKIKHYTMATLVYLFLYALISGLFLLSGVLKWWLLVIVLLVVGIWLWLQKSPGPFAVRFRQLHLQSLAGLAIATFLQLALITAIYFVELRSVSPGVHLSQVIVYAGAANFALFVAFTPGAIGFRETFLLFSRRLHHIGSGAIIAANFIDRSVYIVLLLVLAVLIFGTHVREQFKPEKISETGADLT